MISVSPCDPSEDRYYFDPVTGKKLATRLCSSIEICPFLEYTDVILGNYECSNRINKYNKIKYCKLTGEVGNDIHDKCLLNKFETEKFDYYSIYKIFVDKYKNGAFKRVSLDEIKQALHIGLNTEEEKILYEIIEKLISDGIIIKPLAFINKNDVYEFIPNFELIVKMKEYKKPKIKS